MTDLITADGLTALLQVVMIDLVLAGDNAVVIGLAAASLPPDQRRRAILVGILAATALRILFAAAATQLLQVLGLLLVGGILLLWGLLEDVARATHLIASAKCRRDAFGPRDRRRDDFRTRRTQDLRASGGQIVVAVVSMSLDNVLAVAGAAREHPFILVFGLLLSIALMGIAADLVGRLLQKHRWIAYIGLAIVVYVACEMIYRGAHELTPMIGSVDRSLS